MTVSDELIDGLLADYKKPEDFIGENGLLKQLTQRLVERALQAEMAQHLGHAKGYSVVNAAGNTRNGPVVMPDNARPQPWALRLTSPLF